MPGTNNPFGARRGNRRHNGRHHSADGDDPISAYEKIRDVLIEHIEKSRGWVYIVVIGAFIIATTIFAETTTNKNNIEKYQHRRENLISVIEVRRINQFNHENLCKSVSFEGEMNSKKENLEKSIALIKSLENDSKGIRLQSITSSLNSKLHDMEKLDKSHQFPLPSCDHLSLPDFHRMLRINNIQTIDTRKLEEIATEITNSGGKDSKKYNDEFQRHLSTIETLTHQESAQPRAPGASTNHFNNEYTSDDKKSIVELSENLQETTDLLTQEKEKKYTLEVDIAGLKLDHIQWLWIGPLAAIIPFAMSTLHLFDAKRLCASLIGHNRRTELSTINNLYSRGFLGYYLGTMLCIISIGIFIHLGVVYEYNIFFETSTPTILHTIGIAACTSIIVYRLQLLTAVFSLLRKKNLDPITPSQHRLMEMIKRFWMRLTRLWRGRNRSIHAR